MESDGRCWELHPQPPGLHPRSQLAECAEGLGDDLILMRVTGCVPATVVIQVLGDRLRAGPWFGHTGRQAACRPGLQSDAVSRRSALSPQQAGVARPSGPSVFLWLAPGPPPNRPPSMGPWLLGIAGGGSNQGDCGSCVYDPMLHGIIEVKVTLLWAALVGRSYRNQH